MNSILPILIVAALLAGCAPESNPAVPDESPAWDQARLEAIKTKTEADYPALSHINTATLEEWLRTDREMLILDARESEEYAVSHLVTARHVDPGAKAVALKQQFGDALNVRIVVYCSVGIRSAKLTEQLAKAGFTDVHNLNGSIFQWANEGRPLYCADKRVESVHPYDKNWGKLLDSSRWVWDANH